MSVKANLRNPIKAKAFPDLVGSAARECGRSPAQSNCKRSTASKDTEDLVSFRVLSHKSGGQWQSLDYASLGNTNFADFPELPACLESLNRPIKSCRKTHKVMFVLLQVCCVITFIASDQELQCGLETPAKGNTILPIGGNSFLGFLSQITNQRNTCRSEPRMAIQEGGLRRIY